MNERRRLTSRAGYIDFYRLLLEVRRLFGWWSEERVANVLYLSQYARIMHRSDDNPNSMDM